MIKNYFKTTLRYLFRHPGYVIKSVMSLVICITTCLFVLAYVYVEQSYDRHIPEVDQIYRITTAEQKPSYTEHSALTSSELAPVLQSALPDYELVRLYHWPYNDIYVRNESNSFAESRFYRADSTFFSVFSLDFLSGSSEYALKQPYSIVLSQSAAIKYFSDTDPVGQTLLINNRDMYTVTGVVQDLPANTHFHFDFLAFNGRAYPDGWMEKKVWTYIKVPEGGQHGYISHALSEVIDSHYPSELKGVITLNAQPVKDIHLDSHVAANIMRGGNRMYLHFFIGIAIVFLVVGCINYINLETARSTRRVKEIGIRKAIGATKGQVKIRVLIEAICCSVIAILLSALLYTVLRGSVNTLIGITLPVLELNNPLLWGGLLIGVFVVAFIAGGYPALYLSWVPTIKALKGRISTGGEQSVIREALVVVQFVAVLILIVGALVVQKQINFMLDDARGMDRESVVMIRVPNQVARSWDWDASIFTTELKSLSSVLEVSSIEIPWGKGVEELYVQNTIPGSVNQVLTNIIWTSDDQYADIYGLTLLDGRTRLNPLAASSDSTVQESYEVVINEKAANYLELIDPIGKEVRISMASNEWEIARIVGLVKDAPYRSLHQEIQPLLFINGVGFSDIAVRTLPGAEQLVIEQVASTWARLAPEWPLDYFFLEENYRQQYQQEEQVALLSKVFAFIVMCIASFGLWGLISYITEHRTKEIGIRKVLGASSANIAWLVSKDFVKLIALASVVAVPLALFIITRWLEYFAFRTQLSIAVVILPVVLLSVMVVLTTGYRVIRIATTNPVNTIKYE